jgi:hypothetical protein
MIDYDYLDWGVGLPIEDDFKKIDYREQSKYNSKEVDADKVIYDGDKEDREDNDYDVWYLQLPTERTWTEDPEQIKSRRAELEKQIADYAAAIVPGHELWRRGTSVFLDAFLLEPVSDIGDTKYDNVLLLASEGICEAPLAVIWEMIPECKRNILMNVQRAGKKIYGVVNNKYCHAEEGLLCLEIYGKK